MGKHLSKETAEYIRECAIKACVDEGFSPSIVHKILRVSEQTVYRWLKAYKQDGELNFEANGRPTKVSEEIVLEVIKITKTKSPSDYSIDASKWTNKALSELLSEHFDIKVSSATIKRKIKKRL